MSRSPLRVSSLEQKTSLLLRKLQQYQEPYTRNGDEFIYKYIFINYNITSLCKKQVCSPTLQEVFLTSRQAEPTKGQTLVSRMQQLHSLWTHSALITGQILQWNGLGLDPTHYQATTNFRTPQKLQPTVSENTPPTSSLQQLRDPWVLQSDSRSQLCQPLHQQEHHEIASPISGQVNTLESLASRQVSPIWGRLQSQGNIIAIAC